MCKTVNLSLFVIISTNHISLSECFNSIAAALECISAGGSDLIYQREKEFSEKSRQQGNLFKLQAREGRERQNDREREREETDRQRKR